MTKADTRDDYPVMNFVDVSICPVSGADPFDHLLLITSLSLFLNKPSLALEPDPLSQIFYRQELLGI